MRTFRSPTVRVVAAAAAAGVLAMMTTGCGPREEAEEVTGPAEAVYDAPPADRAAVVAEIEARRDDPQKSIDEFDEMILATDMDGAQLGAFLAAVEDRHARWAAYRQGETPKKLEARRADLAEARAAGNEDLVAQTQARLDALAEDQTAYRTTIRAEVVRIMDLEQQRDWAAFVLWGHWGKLHNRFRRVDLTEKQIGQAKAICREECADLVGPGTMQEDPYLWCIRRGSEESRAFKDRVAERIRQEVLTEEQRAHLAA